MQCLIKLLLRKIKDKTNTMLDGKTLIMFPILNH